MKLSVHPLPLAISAGEWLAALGVEAGRGLALAEAQARLAELGPNALPETKRKPQWRVFLTQFQSPLICILLVAAELGKHGDAAAKMMATRTGLTAAAGKPGRRPAAHL